MSREAFYTSAVNPNETAGGCGCVCDPTKVTDCTGPYTIFPNVETDSGVSPHIVVGARCLRKAAAALDGEVQRTADVDVPAHEVVVLPDMPDDGEPGWDDPVPEDVLDDIPEV